MDEAAHIEGASIAAVPLDRLGEIGLGGVEQGLPLRVDRVLQGRPVVVGEAAAEVHLGVAGSERDGSVVVLDRQVE